MYHFSSKRQIQGDEPSDSDSKRSKPASAIISGQPQPVRATQRYLSHHYENMPMQYTVIFKVVKNENFLWKSFDIFFMFAQNIDCVYTLEPPRRGGSNEYPQSMFLSKNKKNRYTPAYPSFTI